ncbi:hypothetical protein PS1_033117 [Malus domestica]
MLCLGFCTLVSTLSSLLSMNIEISRDQESTRTWMHYILYPRIDQSLILNVCSVFRALVKFCLYIIAQFALIEKDMERQLLHSFLQLL